VAEAIRRCWQRWRSGEPPTSPGVEAFERRELTRKLAKLFDEVLKSH
jgi:hypothetical protein